MEPGVQHKYEKIESAKILCGECNHVWYKLKHKPFHSEKCPECGTEAIMLEVHHITQKESI